MLQRLWYHRKHEYCFFLFYLVHLDLLSFPTRRSSDLTFLGARARAQNRAAQSSLRNALVAAKTIFTDNNDYTQATTTNMLAVEPSLTYVAAGTASTGPTSEEHTSELPSRPHPAGRPPPENS